MCPKSNLPCVFLSIRGHNSDECLLWPFGGSTAGYGQVKFGGRKVYVHRLAFYIANGRWPEPHGCHSCDNPTCFNPRHIFEGDDAINMHDAAQKGRVSRGEKRWKAKLTADIVRQIRTEYVPGDGPHNQIALARKYGVVNQTISRVIKRQDWRHV